MSLLLSNILSFDSEHEIESDEETEISNLKKQEKFNTLPWIEKYRPSSLDDIISHDDIINTLRVFIKNKCLPHLLFYGPPGTGKTSTITACAKELYGNYYPYMVMELNSSDDRGIEVVRTKIKQFVSSDNVFFGETPQEKKNIFKLVILDETDAMTSDAQAILRKVVEEYTFNTRFCLICNYIQNIIPALQSRCTRFRFSPLNKEHIKQKVKTIITAEKIKITNSGLNTVVKRSSGDMRKVLNMLQAVSMAYDLIDENNINICMGYPSKIQMNQIMTSIINDDFKTSYNIISKIKYDNGLSLDDILQEIHDILVDYIITDDTTFSTEQITHMLDKLRMIEFNQSVNTTENIQLSGLIGIMKIKNI